jgi:heme exporter protein A
MDLSGSGHDQARDAAAAGSGRGDGGEPRSRAATVAEARDGTSIPRRRWRDHIGVVSPAMAVYDELSALENLRFFAQVRGVGSAEARCRSVLQCVGLDPERRTLARGYSTGMIQRLKIAQAMLHEPQVLLLDEPGSNLDPEGVDWLESWVHEVIAEGRTVILATNDLREMEWGSRRVALAG